METKSKTKKVLNICLNAVSALIFVFVLIIAVSALTSIGKGYTVIFGHTFYSVKTDSMVGENDDSFNPNDILVIKVLSDSEKADLQVGQVISFWDKIDGKEQINTHRITEVHTDSNGIVYYMTKGDNAVYADLELRPQSEIIGVYAGKAPLIGGAILWMQTSVGFFVSIVLPSILLVMYSAFVVIVQVLQYNKSKDAASKEEIYARAKAEALKELEEKAAKNAKEQMALSDEAEINGDKQASNDEEEMGE